MKAHFESVTKLWSALVLTLASGCWTPDAHNQNVDSGAAVEASNLCGLSKARCIQVDTLPASGVLCDLSASDVGSTFPLQLQSGYSGQFFSPGPDKDAGIPNGVSRVQSDPNDPNSPYHYAGTIPGAASWGLYLNFPTYTCPDGSSGGGGIDASAYDGVSIAFGGNAGPPGQMTFTIDSFGTRQDPYRQQELQTVITVPPLSTTPPYTTTYNFLWSDLTAKCGTAADFQPGKVISIGGSFLALAGIAYDFDVEIGAIGFFHKSQ
jgi:hypothetical protein